MKSKKFRQIDLQAKRLVNSYNSGNHPSFLIDNTDELYDTRRFQSGDKKLDVKNSIKYREIISRTFNPEKQLDIYIVLDISQSQECGKIDVCCLTSLYLNYLAEINGDQVCLITFNDKIKCSQSTVNYGEIANIIQKIEFSGISDFDNCLKNLIGISPENSLIFIISDFLFNFDKNLLKTLTSNNSVYTVILTESHSFLKGIVSDAETGESFYTASKLDYDNRLITSNTKVVKIDVNSMKPLATLIKSLTQ